MHLLILIASSVVFAIGIRRFIRGALIPIDPDAESTFFMCEGIVLMVIGGVCLGCSVEAMFQ